MACQRQEKILVGWNDEAKKFLLFKLQQQLQSSRSLYCYLRMRIFEHKCDRNDIVKSWRRSRNPTVHIVHLYIESNLYLDSHTKTNKYQPKRRKQKPADEMEPIIFFYVNNKSNNLISKFRC